MLNFLSLWLLDSNTVNGDGQLCLGGFGALGLLDLLTELELPDPLLHHVNTLGLLYFS